jgi:glycosyltransferase involved in cell wall biosynthesis
MNVLIFTSWYPSQGNPIDGIFVKKQAEALSAAGVSITVCYPYDTDMAVGKETVENEDSITVYRSNCGFNGGSKAAKLLSYFKAARRLPKIARERAIDVIHVHSVYPAGLAMLAYRFMGGKSPYVITEHRSNENRLLGRFYSPLVKAVYRNARAVICVGEALAGIIGKSVPEANCTVIDNLVSVDNGPAIYKPIIDSVTILLIGSMREDEIKGHQFFLPALARLMKLSDKKISAVLIGDGPTRAKYEALAEELGVRANCEFLGQLPNEKTLEYISECHFLVVASLYETFGVVLIEAMAQGKPVVATRSGGPDDIVNEVNGLLVDTGSTEQLADAMGKMIENYSSYDPEAIKRYVRERYSCEVVAEKIIAVYSRMQPGRKAELRM